MGKPDYRANKSNRPKKSSASDSKAAVGKTKSPSKEFKKPFEKKEGGKPKYEKKEGGKPKFEKKEGGNSKPKGEKKPFVKGKRGEKSLKFDAYKKKPSGDKPKTAGASTGKPAGKPAGKTTGKPSAPSASKVPVRTTGIGGKPTAAAKLELVENLKSDWNKVRVKSTSAEERSKLIEKLLKSIKGHVLQVTLRHDVSRIVQCILQFGNAAQKTIVLTELAAKIVEICKTPYGHFTVLKAITYCTGPADQKKVVNALAGHFVALGTNVIGARAVESVLQMYPTKITRGLKAEFYGKNFNILLAETPKSLRELIEGLPNKESAILDHMGDLIQKFSNKGLLEFSFVHHLLWEYIQEVRHLEKPNKMNALIQMFAEAGTKLMTTKPGAKAMCLIASHSNAKDRKRILKSLKGHVVESVMHSSAHLAVMRIIDVTDDTVSVQKMVLAEIRSMQVDPKYTAAGELMGKPLPPLVAIALHPQGSKLLLRLLAPHKRHLEPVEEELFAALPASSKKSPALRRKEHLTYMKAPLISACARYASTLLRDRCGSRVLQEVINVFYPQRVLDAVVKVFVGDDSVEEGVEDDVEEEVEEEDEEEEEEEMVEGIPETDDYLEEEGGEAEGEEEMLEEMEQEEDDELVEEEEEEVESPAAVAVPAVELLSIEEDVYAHQALRRVLETQVALEAGNVVATAIEDAASTAVSTELHDEADGADSPTGFATALLEAVAERELISKWVDSSRACFALAQLLSVPSAKTAAVKKIYKAKVLREAVQAGAAKDSAGAVKLLETIGSK